MKKFLASTALALMVAGPVLGEAHMGAFVDTSAEGDIYASNLIGMRLYVAEAEIDDSAPVTADARTEWDDVGEINDALISTDGEVKAVLLDIGGFLGMGEKTIAVDMDSLKFLHDQDDPTDVFVAMQGTQEVLEGAPEFKRQDMTEMDQAQTDAAAVPAADTAAADTAATDTAAADTAATDTAAADTAATDTAAADTTAAADATASGDPMTAWERPAIEREGYQTVEAGDLTVDDVKGATVYGADDGSIGEVEDLVISEDGQIQQAIIDVGGFLGMGEHRIALAFDEVQIVRSDDGSDLRVYVAASEEQLEQRPEYEG